MKYLRIQNINEIDFNGFYLLGATSKEGDEAKIGFFGSGNKYALATLLRKGIPFKMFSGTTEIHVTTKEITFRNQTYFQIYLNDIPTSYTTRMGPQWETWFALRELVCNAIDEGELEVERVTDPVLEGIEGYTVIYIGIEPDNEVEAFYDDMHLYIRFETANVSYDTQFGEVSVYERKGIDASLSLYRKHVRCNTTNSLKSLYHYDFDKIRINESRVYIHEFETRERVAAFWLTNETVEDLHRLEEIFNDDGYFESQLKWTYVINPPSTAWKNLIGARRVYSKSVSSVLPFEDILQGFVAPDDLFEYLKKHLPELNFFNKQSDYTVVEMSDEQEKLLSGAIVEAASFGYNAPSYQIQIVNFDDKNVIGLCIRTKRLILLSTRVFDETETGFELINIVVEELLHTYGYSDGSREYEQFLVKELIRVNQELGQLKLTQEPK